MIRHVTPYIISLGLHLSGFFLVALLASYRSFTPPVVIDFTVSSAHALVEKQAAATPAPPSPTKEQPRQPQPRTVSEPQPIPQPIVQQSVQAVSQVAVDQAPREPAPPAPQPVAAPAPTKQQTGRPVAAASSSGGSPSGADSKGAAEQASAKYVKEQFSYIRDKISSHVRYPRHARRMGWSGSVQVSFIIEENGSVSDVRVVRSCQVGMLDDEALDSVKRSAPFPRPPVRARIIIPVEFVLG